MAEVFQNSGTGYGRGHTFRKDFSETRCAAHTLNLTLPTQQGAEFSLCTCRMTTARFIYYCTNMASTFLTCIIFEYVGMVVPMLALPSGRGGSIYTLLTPIILFFYIYIYYNSHVLANNREVAAMLLH